MAASDDGIMGEKASRYKRNVLVIGFVLAVVLNIKGVDLSQLSLFGVTIGAAPDGKIWVLKIASFVLFYNIMVYLYYGFLDFLDWRRTLLVNHKVPNFGVISLNLTKGHHYFEKTSVALPKDPATFHHGLTGFLASISPTPSFEYTNKLVVDKIARHYGVKSAWKTDYVVKGDFGNDRNFTVTNNLIEIYTRTLVLTILLDVLFPLVTTAGAIWGMTKHVG
jgi:hypothetical protein